MANLDFNSILGTVAQAQEPIIVPVPVQVPAKTKKSTEVSTKTKTPVQNNAPWPAPPVVNFGPSPTVPQDVVPGMPQQPVWQQDLSGFLNGMPLAQAIAPPTYQGFGMPVFSDAQAFAMSPEGYNHVLDTTKNNIAFNNKVAGDNYNNTLNIVKMLQAADSANQEQYSRSIQNRNAVIQGNNAQKQGAFMQSPQEEAGMKLQLSNATTQYHAQLQERLETKMAALHHQYRLGEIAASKAADTDKATKALQMQFKLDSMKTVTDVMKDTYLSAVKGMQPDDLDRYQKALATGDNAMLNTLLNNMQVKDPVSAANLRAGIYAEQYLQSASGLPMGSILANMQLKPEKEKGIPVIKSKEELRKYLKK